MVEYAESSVLGTMSLKGKDLIHELADGAGLLEAKALGGLLQAANHGRGTAEENLDVVGRLGKPLLGDVSFSFMSRAGTCEGAYGDHIGGDIADTTSPALWGLVKDVVDADASILLGEGIEVFFEEDILGGDIGKDEVDLGLVSGSSTSDNSAHDLEHRSDTSATGDHTEVSDHVRGVDKGTLGATDTDGLANNKRGHVLGDVALGVGLDQEIEVTGLVVTRDGSVRANNLLGGAVRLDDGGAN